MQHHEMTQAFEAILSKIRHDSARKAKQSRNATSEQSELEPPQFSEEILQSLTVMFPTILHSALNIVDFGKVTKFVCRESRRWFYRVQESSVQSAGEQHAAKPANERTASGAVYYDLVGDMCCCFFYTQKCLLSCEAMVCKHVLAARLADALSETYEDKMQVKEIPDVDFALLILSSKNHQSFKDRKSNNAF